MSLILRGFSALLQNTISIAARGSTLIATGIFSSINAVWEAVFGSSAPGALLPYMMPHDHGPDGGGAPIPRGCIYSFDVGDEQAFETSFSGAATWGPIILRDYTFPAFVSHGIDSDDDSIVGIGIKCYLQAKVLCVATSTGAQLRLANHTKTTTPTGIIPSPSAAVVVPTTLSWVTVDQIPCAGGRWNNFDIEVQQADPNANTIRVYALSLHELRNPSQPASAGQYTYTSVPRPS
jgi:hypothetical protein